MVDYDTLIQFETENSSLDFKAIQYKKELFEEFIKDIISMANADTETFRHIIIGVKLEPNGERKLLGIKDPFIDSSTYQQLINDNVEPSIELEYFPYKFESNTFGIFRIFDCNNKPYVMKKDYGNSLKKGDCYIRKGTHKTRMLRRDFDRIYEQKGQTEISENDIEICFFDTDSNEINLHPIKNIELASKRAKQEILKILEDRKEIPDEPQNPVYPIGSLGQLSLAFDSFRKLNDLHSLGKSSYTNKTTTELEECLKTIEKDYLEADFFELWEYYSDKINFNILNSGKKYIEDASIFIEIPKIDGLLIADHYYKRPVYPLEKFDYMSVIRNVSPLSPIRYPNVEEKKAIIEVSENIGNLKHHIKSVAFTEPIRIIIREDLKDQTIEIKAKIFGKELPEPISKILRINVI